jgi:hypothetical protein
LRDQRDEALNKLEENKDFYEAALEERFEQMEAFERECLELRKELADKKGAATKEMQETWARERAELEGRIADMEGQVIEAN